MILKCVQVSNHDLDKINLLMRRSKAYWGYDEAFMGKFMQLFQMTADYLEKNTVKLFCVLEDDQCDKPIGFYSFSENMKEPELDNFFIDPEYIGKGFGKKVWSILIEDFKSQGVSKFMLWSDPGAEVFYKKMGCVKIGVKKSPMMPDRYPVIFEYTI
ncbi:MAG: GNAT family N-acetyltransferase [Legionellales bacterium]|nr:GNAT family N-acetyltransferase [Legionellales bacterium]